jgi:hypothetical protein
MENKNGKGEIKLTFTGLLRGWNNLKRRQRRPNRKKQRLLPFCDPNGAIESKTKRQPQGMRKLEHCDQQNPVRKKSKVKTISKEERHFEHFDSSAAFTLGQQVQGAEVPLESGQSFVQQHANGVSDGLVHDVLDLQLVLVVRVQVGQASKLLGQLEAVGDGLGRHEVLRHLDAV